MNSNVTIQKINVMSTTKYYNISISCYMVA